ncbi:MAG TPA: peptidoglycan DD-metalloendopeptidase family protein [Dokdonella sp.]
MQATLLLMLLIGPATSAGIGEPQQTWLFESEAAQDALDAARHAQIATRLQDRIAALRRSGRLPAHEKTAGDGVAGLAWPLQAAPGFFAFDYHGVSNFVDHDARFPGFLQDYTCGARTYDLASGYNHGGTDYFLWPFPWLMMDQQDVRIVAAAAGVIIEKDDGHFDRDCALGSASDFNAVFVLQDDGLTAWYLHMKSGSLTALAVGTRVAAGAYLGAVGSSGSSTGPHLHFELNDANGNVIDPRHGQCNAGPDRWIVSQPYEAARIDTLTTHSAEPAGVACGIADGQPVHESPAYQDRFMPGDTLWAFASYSDQRNGEITHFSLLRPDASVSAQWDFDLASQNLPRPFYAATGFDWTLALPADAPVGTWQLQATFEGTGYRHSFEVGLPVDLDQRGLTGVWSIAGVEGQGIALESSPDFYGSGTALLFAGWFTYAADASGAQQWYTLQGQASSASASAAVPIYLTQGGRFDAADPTTTLPVGAATLQFSDCEHGSLDYVFSDGSGRAGSLALIRSLPNVTCTPGGDGSADTSDFPLSGAWADLGADGQGVFLEINPLQGILFGGWFTYAGDGGAASSQRWLTLQAAFDGDAAAVDDIGVYETTGGLFDLPDAPTTLQVGLASITFASCSEAQLDYAFSAGESAGTSGHIMLVRLQAAPAECVLP